VPVSSDILACHFHLIVVEHDLGAEGRSSSALAPCAMADRDPQGFPIALKRTELHMQPPERSISIGRPEVIDPAPERHLTPNGWRGRRFCDRSATL